MPLNYLPEPESDELEYRKLAATVAHDFIRPTTLADDEACLFRRSIFQEMAKRGLTGISVPTAWGGAGKSYQCYYAVIEELSKASVAWGVTVGVTNLVQGAITSYGNENQKKRYLTPLAKGEWLGAFSLSEPHAGSDAASLRLSVKTAPGGYVLNGNKVWCSNAGHADLYLVMGRTGEHKSKGITSFLVPADTKGFRVGKHEKKLGLKTSTLSELVFEDCFIPTEQRLGNDGDGLAVALSQLDAGRITIGTAGIALSMEALDLAWKYGLTHAWSDETFQVLSHFFAETQSARLLVNQAARLRDQKKNLTVIASQTKLLGSDLAMKVSSDVLTLLGTDGTLPGFHVERLFRDAKALQIVEGTNQVQGLVLAREMRRQWENR